jgi:TolA-binding protein
MKSDLDTIGKNRQSSEQNLRTQVAQMNANMANLQEDVRLLTGRVEELEYSINRKTSGYETAGKKYDERLDEMSLSLSKLDQRLIQLEQYLSVDGRNARSSTGAKSGDAAAAAPGASASEDPEKSIYEKARQAYDNGEMDKSRQLFQALIQKYPKGNKVPAAMLKQGLALLQIGEKSSARLILQELVDKYPDTSASKIAAKKLKEF